MIIGIMVLLPLQHIIIGLELEIQLELAHMFLVEVKPYRNFQLPPLQLEYTLVAQPQASLTQAIPTAMEEIRLELLH